MGLLLEFLAWFFLKIAEAIPGKFLDWVLGLFGKKRKKTEPDLFSPYPVGCGDHPIDLGNRKPYVTDYFGSYFAGLLEDDLGYLQLDAQLDVPSTPETNRLTPIARLLYEFRKPTGARLLVIAADGGMGKTTLAAKIVKCLYEQKDAELILGDSAKTEHFDPAQNCVVALDPFFDDARSFYRRLYSQVGLPLPVHNKSISRMAQEMVEQLRDVHAVIVIDNLDTVKDVSALYRSLKPLLGRNVRAVVTTRQLHQQNQSDMGSLIVNLKPIIQIDDAGKFLRWHIEHYRTARSNLDIVADGLKDKSNLRKLIEVTGGVPLVMQLVINDIETQSWDFLKRLPNISLSTEMLEYLYKKRWDELETIGASGQAAKKTVEFIVGQQARGKRVTYADLSEMASVSTLGAPLAEALSELDARFLILNRDPTKGNYSVFPSFAEYIKRRLL